MADLKVNPLRGGRVIGAALALAVAMLAGAWLPLLGAGQPAVIWVTTAVYMLGPLAAAALVLPLLNGDWWLFVTAVLIALAIVFPWALINPARWAAVQLPQLGLWGNVLFGGLLFSCVSAGRPSRTLSWLLTGFYLLIMWVVAALL